MYRNTQSGAAQVQFTENVRTGKYAKIPGLLSNRMPHYRRLVRNAFDDTLQTTCPITHAILKGAQWNQLVDGFMANYKSESPLIWRLAESFYNYIEEYEVGAQLKSHYLADLVRFEWLELEVHALPDVTNPTVLSTIGKSIKPLYNQDPIMLNPYMRVATFKYPVFQGSVQDWSSKKGNYYLLIFRHLEKMTVHFMKLSPFFAALLDDKIGKAGTWRSWVKETASLLGIESTPSQLVKQSSPLFQDLINKKVIIPSHSGEEFTVNR